MGNVTRLSDAVLMRDFNRLRWDWAHDVAANAGLTPLAKLVAFTLISRHADHATGHCAPGLAHLAATVATPERSVRRALTELEAAGYLARGPGGYRGTPVAIRFFLGARGGAQPQPAEKPATDGHHRPAERRPDPTRKVARSCIPPTPPYKAIQTSPKARAADMGQARAPAKVTRLPVPAPDPQRCPVTHVEPVVPGTAQAAAWDLWLAAHGFPGLGEIGRWLDPAEKRAWGMSSRSPPDPGLPHAVRAALRFAGWLCARIGIDAERFRSQGERIGT